MTKITITHRCIAARTISTDVLLVITAVEKSVITKRPFSSKLNASLAERQVSKQLQVVASVKENTTMSEDLKFMGLVLCKASSNPKI